MWEMGREQAAGEQEERAHRPERRGRTEDQDAAAIWGDCGMTP